MSGTASHRAGGGSGALRFGVLGATSTVARRAVLPALAASTGAQVVALGTRAAADLGHAGAGASRDLARLLAPFDPAGARVHPRYQEVIDDPDVEALYVALPNGLHAEWTLRAAAAGKHVLCEKPLTVDPHEARSMVAACREAGVVLAEAYMTPFHPRVAALASLVQAGGIGAPRFARASFSFPLGRPDDHRWDRTMGGGALADVGVYCLAPVLGFAGRRPRRIAASAVTTPWGVDASTSGWLDLGEGFCATVECSFEAPECQHLTVVGTEGRVSIERAFTPGPGDTGFEVQRLDGAVHRVESGGADPYLAMVEEFAAVVRGTAAPARSLDDALAVIEVADELRRAAAAGGAAASGGAGVSGGAAVSGGAGVSGAERRGRV